MGAGNAGHSAATTAAQLGISNVLLIEKGPESSGRNTYFTAGAYRTVFHGLEDVLPLVCNVSQEQAGKIDMNPYTEANFLDDLNRVTDGRTDPALAETPVKNSRETIGWLKDIGVQFTLSFNRQAYEVDGRQKFWGGMVCRRIQSEAQVAEGYRFSVSKMAARVLFATMRPLRRGRELQPGLTHLSQN